MPWGLIGTIKTFFGIGTSINGLLAVIGITLVIGLSWGEWRHRAGVVKGGAEVRTEVNEGAARAEEKSFEERRRSERPGALERLRADPATCPGCKPQAGNGQSVPVVGTPADRK